MIRKHVILARFQNLLITTHYFKPHTEALPCYIKDTADSIDKINSENIAGETFLLIFSVKCLCINIPNKKRIEAAKEDLKSQLQLKLLSNFYFSY